MLVDAFNFVIYFIIFWGIIIAGYYSYKSYTTVLEIKLAIEDKFNRRDDFEREVTAVDENKAEKNV